MALAFGVALGGGASAGCATTGPSAGEPRLGPLPAWEGRARELFDDQIDSSGMGIGITSDAHKDPALRERARSAELVSRVRVSTVTVESLAEVRRYRLVVQVVPPPFGTPTMERSTLELVVAKGDPSYGVVDAFDMRLRGASFIGFLRRFVGDGEEPSLHWHLSPDTAEVAAAVTDAIAFAELSGS